MPSVSINALNPANAAAANARSHGNANASRDDEARSSFADQLNQARRPADDAAAHAHQDTAQKTANADASGPAADAAREAGKAERADKDDQADKAKAGKSDKTAKGSKGDKDAAAQAGAGAATPPVAVALPPGWQAAGTPAGKADPAAEAAGDRLGAAAAKGQAKALRAEAARDTQAAASAASAARDPAKTAGDSAGFQAALAAAGGDAKDRTAAKTERASDALTSIGAPDAAALGHTTATATGDTGAAASAASAAPFDAQLSAAMGTPEFAPALGVQLSVLAREGVQEARLHLNPAEMGPIAVQIAVDGNTAVVHFQADVAATRQALESSLPDLAAAMRDSGFTLSGGSVSSQSSGGQGANGRGDGEPGSRQLGGVSATASAAPDAAAPVRMSAPQAARLRGGVDVFA